MYTLVDVHYSPVVEGGVSPPREGVYETRCTTSMWGRRFQIVMLFSLIWGRLQDMGAFTPKNGPTFSTRENVVTAI